MAKKQKSFKQVAIEVNEPTFEGIRKFLGDLGGNANNVLVHDMKKILERWDEEKNK